MEDKTNDEHSLFLSYLASSEPIIRAYLRSLVQDYHDQSEIMQNVFITAWNKFSSFSGSQDEFCKWACVIARYQAMKHRQNQARDRLVLNDKLITLIADEGIEDQSTTKHWHKKLDICLQKLSPSNRTLIQKAYELDQSIKELANSLNKSPTRVR